MHEYGWLQYGLVTGTSCPGLPVKRRKGEHTMKKWFGEAILEAGERG